MVRQTLADTDGPLQSVWEHPSTQSSVRAAFRQLRNTDETMRSALAARGGVTSEIARLHEGFRRLTGAEWYDTEDLAEAAAEAVRAGAAPGLNDLGLIVFYLPHGLSPGEITLMETLAEHHRCAALLGATGDADADVSTQDLAARLRWTMVPPAGAPTGATDIALTLRVCPTAHRPHRSRGTALGHPPNRPGTQREQYPAAQNGNSFSDGRSVCNVGS